MDFVERQEAVPVSAVFHERRLQRRLYPRYLGKVDVAFELFFCLGLVIELFKTVPVNDDHPGFFRMGGVDQHSFGHRVPPAHNAHRLARSGTDASCRH